MTRVDVCVVTCQRPRGLARLLEGLAELEVPEDVALRVLVVDNDPAESARPVCDRARPDLSWPLDYATEKRRGIPQARNQALALSLPRSDWLAFIDDDEVPDPDWLVRLLAARSEYEADAVTGPAVPCFETPPAAWLADSRLFDGPRHATGTRVATAYTHNVLVSSRALGALSSHFDESMALTGSSDSELFERFVAEGHRVVWCDEARTREWVPASRARLGWLLRRALRLGSTRSWRQRRAGRSLLPILAHAGWCLARGLGTALAGVVTGRAVAARGLFLASFGLGRLAGLSGWVYQEYRRIHGA